ncbi:protein-L-isoaspartate O-methyltransferase family protein [Falsiroseomonas sp. CW058]|uniref:protein-L-isoaspartate O-methyltransferase family protein n=1 Tax=Falsiroseomonas sp. CW058 TaxID=3388664 RepID=UPI003D31CFF6
MHEAAMMHPDTAAGTAQARRHMVDGQLRPNRITDPRLLSAMLDIPRESFLPPGLAARAYTDEDVPLPGGRALMEPMVLAKLLQILALRDGDRLLIVGAGSGYSSAVAAHCGARVVALEEDAALAAAARSLLPAFAAPGSVQVVHGGLAAGHAAGAPYDAILIEGEVPEVPEGIAAQLAEGGRLATVLAAASRGLSSRAVLGRRIGGTFSVTDAFDCATLPLPAFLRSPGFVF